MFSNEEVKKPTMFMMVGIPCSCKTSFAHEYLACAKCFSSDDIREELQTLDNTVVFNTLNSRVIDALKHGHSCVYDATNLSRRRRMAFIKQIRRINCYKICYIMLSPREICEKRNEYRPPEAINKIPPEVFDRMIQNFQVPNYYEGWDNILFTYTLMQGVPCERIEPAYLIGYDQHNPHHKYTLGEHINLTEEYVTRYNPTLDTVRMAARYHDIGKVKTRTFNADGIAQYYNHANYSAYQYLVQHVDTSAILTKDDFNLEVANIINWHMEPFGWEKNDRQRQYAYRLLSEDLFNKIMILHEADIASCGG